ncbi:MAG: histidine phosphatase family protein [Eubacteriales bacterium]|nr:histidine phosphatase family protein [Eubacteriales bacterium]
MELYIIRHGDPDYKNDTLTEKGWDEARQLAQRMANTKPTKIYSSPRGRAQDTAKPTCELLGMTYKVEEWTTESMDYMQYPSIVRGEAAKCGWETDFNKGVQNFADFAGPDRAFTIDELSLCSDAFLSRHGYVRKGLGYQVKKASNDKIAVFCHGGFGAAWIAHLLSLPPAMGWMHFMLTTTSVTKFLFESNDQGYTFPNLVYLNDTCHIVNNEYK